MKRFVTFSSRGVPRGDVRGRSDPSRSSSSSPAGAQSQCGALRGAGAPPSPPRPPPHTQVGLRKAWDRSPQARAVCLLRYHQLPIKWINSFHWSPIFVSRNSSPRHLFN